MAWCRCLFTCWTIVALSLVAFGHSSAAREFRVADTQAEDYPTVQALYYFDRLIRERTGGRHSIAVFHSRQLGEEKETIEQTRFGAIDLNRTNVAPLSSVIPDANVLSLPFLFRSEEHLHKVLDGPIGDEILAGFEAYGLVGLAFYDSGARSVYNAVRPVRSPADMKGLRIRVQQSDLMIDMMRALGAEPVALPYGQVVTGLTTHLIDGAENNWPSYVTTDHYRLARFITLTEHTMSPEVLVMSLKAWQSLSPEDREIFKAAAKESAVFMRQRWLEWEARSREEAKRNGNEIIADFDKAAFEAAVAPVYAGVLTDPRLKALAERIKALR